MNAASVSSEGLHFFPGPLPASTNRHNRPHQDVINVVVVSLRPGGHGDELGLAIRALLVHNRDYKAVEDDSIGRMCRFPTIVENSSS